MQIVDHIPRIEDFYTDSLTKRKLIEIAAQKYARFDFLRYNKSILCFCFSSRIVDNRSKPPQSPPSAEIKPQHSVISSLSPSTNSSPLSLHLGEDSKSFFKKSVSHSESFASTTSKKVTLMSGSEQSNVVQPLLTDLYQISMAYAYWKSNKHQEIATFDLYFRKNRKL
jgi:hypothetical protein